MNVTPLVGPLGLRAPAAGTDRPNAPTAWLQSSFETAFLGFAFLVLQGAFIGMAAPEETGEAVAAEGTDLRHMLAFALLLFGTAIFAPKHWRGIAQIARSNVIYFILPAMIVASVLWSIDPLLTLKRSLLTAGVCLFDLYVVAAVSFDRLLKLLSATIFISALASVVTAIAFPAIGREVGAGLTGDWRGIFPQKNAFGHVMSVGVFIQLSLMIRAQRPLLGAGIGAALCILLVALADSASSLLAVALALLLSGFYIAFRRGTASIAVCGLVSIGVIALIAAAVATDLSAALQLFDRDTSLTGRTDLWAYVLDAIDERPLAGWGYTAFWAPDSPAATYLRSQVHWDAPNAHDGYLELALGLGLIGLAGFVVTGVWTLRRIVILFRKQNELGILLLIISVQLMAANLTESFMISASVFGWNIYSIVVLAAGAALSRGPEADTAEFGSILYRAKAR
jgi:exopolysaccharide production protein ExoQ